MWKIYKRIMKRKVTKELLDKSYSDFENLTNICGASGHTSDIKAFGYCTMCGKSKHGGSRKGAGRPKLKKSEKKEPTKVMRVPVSKVDEVNKVIKK